MSVSDRADSAIQQPYGQGFERYLLSAPSEKGLKLIGLQRQFTQGHGYVTEEVKIAPPWSDDSFLREAFDREGLAWPV